MRLSAYLHFAVNELFQAGQNMMQPTVYDTAWIARLQNDDRSLAYPESLQWVLAQQHPDGSWGSQIPYMHDRILTTLAVVLLLARVGHRQKDREQQKSGERYIWQNAGRLHYDPDRTIGFEMLLPTFLAEAKELGLQLPYQMLSHYEKERAIKLGLLPTDQLFKVRTTALFSLEAFATNGDVASATKLLSQNGSMAVSPSATAFLLSKLPAWRSQAGQSVAYLEALLASHEGGLPHVAPYDLFSRSWTISFLHYGNLLQGHDDLLRSHYEHLLKHWRPNGVAYSSFEEVPNSDDTAMTLLALSRGGYEVDGRCLLEYERKDHFACFHYERDPSLSANLHILSALEILPPQDRERVKEKVLGFIMRVRRQGSFWADKWHASAYYPTSKALMILPAHLEDKLEPTLEWIMATQHPNGAWGQYMPTAEETALTLLALLHYHTHVQELPTDPLHRAAEYLLAHERPFNTRYPELWIGKVLYAPITVIKGTILAALGLYHEVFGKLF